MNHERPFLRSDPADGTSPSARFFLTTPMNSQSVWMLAALVLVLVGISGCRSARPDSSDELHSRFAAASEEHPEGARLSRSEAVRLATGAVAKLGYNRDPLHEPYAVYSRTILGGPGNRDWAVYFRAGRGGDTSGFLVYVDDRHRTTEIVGPSKP